MHIVYWVNTIYLLLLLCVCECVCECVSVCVCVRLPPALTVNVHACYKHFNVKEMQENVRFLSYDDLYLKKKQEPTQESTGCSNRSSSLTWIPACISHILWRCVVCFCAAPCSPLWPALSWPSTGLHFVDIFLRARRCCTARPLDGGVVSYFIPADLTAHLSWFLIAPIY